MVFNATFNNISVISWQSVLLVDETLLPGEDHQPAASHRQILSHNVVSRTPLNTRKENLIKNAILPLVLPTITLSTVCEK
jgi:hypothetical protein